MKTYQQTVTEHFWERQTSNLQSWVCHPELFNKLFINMKIKVALYFSDGYTFLFCAPVGFAIYLLFFLSSFFAYVTVYLPPLFKIILRINPPPSPLLFCLFSDVTPDLVN